MDKKERAAAKRIVSDTEAFSVLKSFLTALPRPKRDTSEDVASFGARVDAFDHLQEKIRTRFDDLKRECLKDT